jgi:hypothetical protein
VLQVLPHPPQFCGSELAFTHCDPQLVCPAPQLTPPVPAPPVLLEPPMLPLQAATNTIATVVHAHNAERFMGTAFRIKVAALATWARNAVSLISRKCLTTKKNFHLQCILCEPVFGSGWLRVEFLEFWRFRTSP